MAPGATQFTRMPYAPNSTAATFVNISMPPLLAVYATRFGNGTLLQPDPMLTMLPPPWSFMCRAAACVQRKVPFRLVSITQVPLALLDLEQGLPRLHAGVVHQHVERAPARHDGRDEVAHLRRGRHAGLHGVRVDAQGRDLGDGLRGRGRRPVVVDRDPVARGGQAQRDALPDPTPRTRHERHASIRRRHGHLLRLPRSLASPHPSSTTRCCCIPRPSTDSLTDCPARR